MIKKEQAAKAIRVITVPPIMVLALLLILFFRDMGIFLGPQELLWSVLFLTVVPLLAYPLSRLLPKYRVKGREGQRNLALVMNLASYAGALLYGLITGVSKGLELIFMVYFLSVLILIVFNKVIGIRASGHASSLAGPLLMSVYFIGGESILPCVLIFGAIAWSSMTLNRHTLKELGFGILSTVLAFGLSVLIIACTLMPLPLQ